MKITTSHRVAGSRQGFNLLESLLARPARRQLSLRGFIAFALAASAGTLPVPLLRAQAVATPSQKEIAARLEHQERLIRTMQCAYDHEYHPTEAAQAALIASKYAKNPREIVALTRTAEQARRSTFTAKWWRKGEKERWDETYPSSGRTLSRAFDGNVVRDVERNEGRSAAELRPLDRSHLRDSVRHQPFALLYELLGTPFSEIIRKGSDFVAGRVDVAGRSCHRVFVRAANKHYCRVGSLCCA